MSSHRWFHTAVVGVILMFGAVGCASTKTTALRVAGTDGAEFTTYYQAERHTGAITSVARPAPPVTVVELPGRGFRCDVRKQDRDANLNIEVYRGADLVLQTYLPPGTEGVRIRQVAGTWREEIY